MLLISSFYFNIHHTPAKMSSWTVATTATLLQRLVRLGSDS